MALGLMLQGADIDAPQVRLQARERGVHFVGDGRRATLVSERGDELRTFEGAQYWFPFSEGIARVHIDQHVRFVDLRGQFVGGVLKGAQDFSEGLAAVTTSGEKWGFIDQRGNEVIACVYSAVSDFSEGVAFVRTVQSSIWAIDASGRKLFEVPGVNSVRSYHCGLAVIYVGSVLGGYGAIDRSGKIVIEPAFVDIHDFSEGLAVAKKEKGFIYIDGRGNVISKHTYSLARDFRNGMGMVYRDGKIGFVDSSGAEVVLCIYDAAENFDGGVAEVVQDGVRMFVDRLGHIR
jgi:hypothetical protein